MGEYFDSPGDATIFSTLDTNSSYWLVQITEEDCQKTEFFSKHSSFGFTQLPLGLRNAPETFRRAMDVLLTKMKWWFALVYLEDILIYSRTPDEYIQHVRQVLT